SIGLMNDSYISGTTAYLAHVLWFHNDYQKLKEERRRALGLLRVLQCGEGQSFLWPVKATRARSMRMEQYLTHTDYALWEVIVNGDSGPAAASAAEGTIPPKTSEQKLAKNNEIKDKSTLLVAIPDEHLLKFHGCKDAKSLWEAIKTRFGGNKESKKMQKTILNQQYKNFAASRNEGL
ncbi:hypothetical protein Tco_0950651, partial [Tanacetum coccineum]